MIDNAIFKLCERKNLFLSSIYLRITIFAWFLTIINKLLQQRKKYLFLHYCVFFHFNCLHILHFDLLYRYIQVVKIILFTLKISSHLFFCNLLSEYANKFSRKGIPSTRFTKYLAWVWPQHKFVIFIPWRVAWNWIAFSQNYFITGFVISPD